MINSILHVLAIIGIIILCLLGIILLLLSAVLFVPIRYRFLIDKENGWEKEKLHIDVKVGWLLGLIRLRVKLESALVVRIKLLCFTLFDSQKPKKESKQSKKKHKTSSHSKERKEDSGTSKEAMNPEVAKQEIKTSDVKSPDKPEKKITETNKMTVSEETVSSGEKIPIWKKIWYTIKKFCDKINYYIELIRSDEFKNGLSFLWGRLTEIIIYVLPTKIRGHVVFGFSEPDKTGYVLGLLCIIRGMKGYDNLDIQPDFEQEIFIAKLQGRGRIRLVTLARHALAVYRDKNLRNLLAHIKQEE